MKKKVKVLQVIPRLGYGGAETVCYYLSNFLPEKGCVSFIATSGGELLKFIDKKKVKLFRLPVHSKNPILMLLNAIIITLIIIIYNINIVHVRSRAPAWSTLSAAKRTGVPLVTTFHGNYGTNNPLKRWYNSVMARGDRVIAISNFIGDQGCSRYGVDPDKIRIIPRGIDTNLFDPAAVTAQRVIQLAERWRLPDDVRVVMLPRRLTRWKGHAVLIDAIARLNYKSRIRCIIVGSDQGRTRYVRELEKQIARQNLQHTVHIAGDCRDMPAAFMLADVVVSTSVEAEAFGRVIAEAQSMGRPVIATDHGAARETVAHNQTGWLVPPGDASALAEALQEALSLEDTARNALAGRVMANVRADYSKELRCDRTMSVYKEMITEKQGESD